VIVAVDGKLTMGQKIEDVEREIRGPIGTVVSLTSNAAMPALRRCT